MRLEHPIDAVYDEKSRVLILGSFPSVKSREFGFFYGHPQNRFWRVVSRICGEAVPETIEEKRAFLFRNNIALWDVIQSCDIEGSADSTIKNVIVNDLSEIVKTTQIKAVFTNGKTADKLYNKYNKCAFEAICLPSTSPANAAWSEDRLFEEWKSKISQYL